jgi:hypothetical protein
VSGTYLTALQAETCGLYICNNKKLSRNFFNSFTETIIFVKLQSHLWIQTANEKQSVTIIHDQYQWCMLVAARDRALFSRELHVLQTRANNGMMAISDWHISLMIDLL